MERHPARTEPRPTAEKVSYGGHGEHGVNGVTWIRFRENGGVDFNIGRYLRLAATPSVSLSSVRDPSGVLEGGWRVLQSGKGAKEISAGRQGFGIAAADHLNCFGEQVDHEIGDCGHGDQEDRGVGPGVTPSQETLGPEQNLEEEWNRKNGRVEIEENNQSEQRQETGNCKALFRPEARELPDFANVVPFRSSQDGEILEKSADVGNRENEKPGERFKKKSEWLEGDLSTPDREHGGWIPPFGRLASVHADEFPAAKCLQTFHPTICQSHRNRRCRAVIPGIAVVAHFCAKIEKGEQKRDGPRAVKRIHGRRGCPEELDGFLDQEQRRSTLNVRRSGFDVQHFVFGECFTTSNLAHLGLRAER
jgi:hypothetical protein